MAKRHLDDTAADSALGAPETLEPRWRSLPMANAALPVFFKALRWGNVADADAENEPSPVSCIT